MIWIARHSPRRNSARLHRIRTRRLTVGRLPRQHKNRHTDQSRRVFGCDRSCRSSKSSDEQNRNSRTSADDRVAGRQIGDGLDLLARKQQETGDDHWTRRD